MSEYDHRSPAQGADFPEIERPLKGTVEEEILAIVVEALNAQSFSGLSIESLRTDPAHRSAAVDMLRDCRPLPVVRELIDKLESGTY